MPYFHQRPKIRAGQWKQYRIPNPLAAKTVAIKEAPSIAEIPLWRESLTGVDYLRLKASKVYYGFGVPKGDNTPVVLVPGFLGADMYLLELYIWLKRMGYTPSMSKIGHNAQCPDVLTHRLLKTVNRAYTDTGKPVHLIGHSFGGVLSRGVAARKPDRVASVITLGSPFRGVNVHPWVMTAVKAVRKHNRIIRRRAKDCFTESCACGFTCTMDSPFPKNVPHTAVYSKTDGVVDWQTCCDDDPATDVQVRGTHIGLVWNPDVYRCIGQRLKEAV